MPSLTLLGAGKFASGGGGASTTWNPSDADVQITLSNGNLTATSNTGGYWAAVRATTSHSSGKLYLEYTTPGSTPGTVNVIFGIANATAPLNNFPGSDANGWGLYNQDGGVYHSGSSIHANDSFPHGANEWGALAVDLTNNLAWWYDPTQNRWNGASAGDPAAGTGGITFTAGTYFPMMAGLASVANPVLTANFGATAFAHTVPSGFSAWG